MERIYLDYAATTPLDKEVFQKMLPYFCEEFGNPDSPHAAGRKAMNGVDFARDSLAAAIGAKPNEIYFTSGGTESDNLALQGCAYAQKERGKTHIILSSIEHHAALAAGEKLAREGFEITYLPVNRDGVVEVENLQDAMTEKTGLVAVMYANNETGAVQPIERLAKVAHEKGALFFTDGVQAAPHLKIDVTELGVDMLALSAHKFYGPKGVGALYIKSGVKMKGVIVGGEQERGLRGGTSNVPAIVGMAAAYLQKEGGTYKTNEKIRALRTLFLDEIKGLDGVEINGGEDGLAAVLNLRFVGVQNTDFVYNMDLKGICVSAGAACASASIKPSHVLLAMGLTENEAKECVRFSFGKDLTEEEVRFAARTAKEVVLRLRGEKN